MTCDVLPVAMCFHLNLAGRCQIFKIIQRWLLSAGKLEHLERGENIHQSVSGSRLVWKGVSLPRCSLMPLSSECLLTCPCLGQLPSRLRHRLSFAHTYCSRSSPLFPDPSSFVIHMVCSVLTCVLDYMQVAPFYILANHVDGRGWHFTLYTLHSRKPRGWQVQSGSGWEEMASTIPTG